MTQQEAPGAEAPAPGEQKPGGGNARAVQRVTLVLLVLLGAQVGWFLWAMRGGGSTAPDLGMPAASPGTMAGGPNPPGPPPRSPGASPGRSGSPAPRGGAIAVARSPGSSPEAGRPGSPTPGADGPQAPGPPDPASPGAPGPPPRQGPGPEGPRGRGETVNVEDLPQFAQSLMSLDRVKPPLTPSQKEGLSRKAADLYEATSAIQGDMLEILAAMSDAQAQELFAPHAPQRDASPPPSMKAGSDPRIAAVVDLLRPKAGPSPLPSAAPGNVRSTGPRVLHRSVLLDGISWLETSSSTPLSPAQARTVLERLEDMDKQGQRAQDVAVAMLEELTPEQRDTLSKRPVLPDALAARALLLWTQRR